MTTETTLLLLIFLGGIAGVSVFVYVWRKQEAKLIDFANKRIDEDLGGRLTFLTDKVSALEKENSALRILVDSLQTKIVELERERIRELEDENAVLKDRVLALQAEIAALKEMIAKISNNGGNGTDAKAEVATIEEVAKKE